MLSLTQSPAPGGRPPAPSSPAALRGGDGTVSNAVRDHFDVQKFEKSMKEREEKRRQAKGPPNADLGARTIQSLERAKVARRALEKHRAARSPKGSYRELQEQCMHLKGAEKTRCNLERAKLARDLANVEYDRTVEENRRRKKLGLSPQKAEVEEAKKTVAIAEEAVKAQEPGF